MSDHRQREAASRLKAMHTGPGFILPNAWDIGSAMMLAAEGFPAIATTSAGVAFSLGKPDYRVEDPRLALTREETLRRAGEIAAVLDVPVSADLEAGFGDSPQAVAQTVRLAIGAGLAGGNIEDQRPDGQGLYEEALAAERIAAAREAIGANDFVLNARTDALVEPTAKGMEEALRRAALYRAAGADCVFTPGPTDLATVQALVAGIKGPLNVVMGLVPGGAGAFELIEAGVKRITLGGTLARAALGLVREAARELRTVGTIGFADGQLSHAEINAVMIAARAERLQGVSA